MARRKRKSTSFGKARVHSPVTGFSPAPPTSAFTPSPGYEPQPNAPPPPDPGPPPDPYFEAQKAAANRSLQLGDATDAFQKSRIENQYGFGVDKSNPYSVANLLQQSYQRGQKATNLGMAAQGQLYSGALQAKLEEGTRQFSVEQDQQQRAYQDALNELLLGKAQRYGSTIGDVSSEQLSALMRALGR